MKYVDDIELSLVGTEIVVNQINFRENICKPCKEVFDKGYIDTTKTAIFGNVVGNIRFSNYLSEEEFGEVIMRLRQSYDVGYTEATYYFEIEKDKLRLAICMNQSKWSGLIYNTKENYEKFDAMLKEIDEEYRTTLINFAKYKLVMFAMAKLMEMETTEQNKVALYLFNNI